MTPTRPETLTITYPGGASASIPFDDLPANLRADILRQPFAAVPSPDPAAESYVLLEWEDGWKEVVQVDAGCTGIRRYYVISRTEEVGRLSLDHESGYPVLLEVERRPGGLKRVTFGETFALAPERSAREGKKTDTWYSLASSGDATAELKEALSAAGGDTAAVGVVAGRRQQDLDDFLASLAD
jgi:hypothetical protein